VGMGVALAVQLCDSMNRSLSGELDIRASIRRASGVTVILTFAGRGSRLGRRGVSPRSERAAGTS
jgi:uncharacterized protein YwlG (UPF0340 family)